MKKLISTALAMAMVLSLASPFGTLVYAEDQPRQTALVEQDGATQETAASEASATDQAENQDTPAPQEDGQQQAEQEEQSATHETAAEPDAVDQVGELFEALPTVETVDSLSEAERQQVMEQLVQAINAYDALTAEEGAAFLARYGALYTRVTETLMAALLSGSGSDTSDLSLQPMPETDAYLTLYGYTVEQLKNFPVDNIPGMLTDALGEPLDVAEGYTGAWFYFAADEVDESHALGAGETVDLWDYSITSSTGQVDTSYTLYLVLGNGKQMNDGNSHRYIVTVEINTMETLSTSLYASTDKNTQLVIKKQNPLFDTLGMPGVSYTFYGSSFEAGQPCRVYFSSNYNVNELKRLGIQMEVYPMGNFLRYRDEGAALTGAITDTVMDMGLEDTYDTQVTEENCKTASNLWCVVFTRMDTGRVLGYMGVSFNVKPLTAMWKARLNVQTGNAMTELDESYVTANNKTLYYELEQGATGNGVQLQTFGGSYGVSFSLPEGYPSDESYYVTMDKAPEIKAVYEGDFDTEVEALQAGAANITGALFSDASQGIPYGYRVTLGSDRRVTVILQDGSAIGFYFYHSNYTWSGSDEDPRNDLDPNFQITGALSESGMGRGYYVADMVRGVQLDTYYRRDDRYDVGGYQMILMDKNFTQEELKQIIPTFWTPEGVQVNSGGKVVSGQTDLTQAVWSDTMPNTVMYQVQVPGEKLRNYQVTFVSRQPEAKLLVAGPDERFVNLTADNNFVHDILVANIGATDLTGIKVELKDAVHVKLDDYWTIGGEGNDTLPAFDGVWPAYETTDEYGNAIMQSTSYASLENIAKVRLLADGEGEISGTLVITAANGDRREIKLTGIAANPHIVSATLQDAVKFVPYSYMVVTDNMYKWNRSTFTLVDGRLPDGMKLYEATGEIYGTPTETGDFTFTVQVDYSSSRFSPSQATYTLHVANNTNVRVYEQSDEGYSIQVPLGVEQGEGTRDFYLADTSTDQLYVSNGVFPEFEAVWLNGKKLINGWDYTAESGSTRITIRSQTFAALAYQDRFNTIAVEFRVDGERNNELKRTAQNFRLDPNLREEPEGQAGVQGGNSGNSGSSGNTTTTTSPAATAQSTARTVDVGQVPENASGVTLRFHVMDGQGGPIVGATAELHSSPRYGTTDGEGCVTFANVEFGAHTLTIYDANGNKMGGKSFTLACGGFGVDGSVITVSDGGLVDINVRVENGTLQFDNVSLAQPASTLPQTGDDFDPTLWVMLAFLSACTAAGLTIYKKKAQR